MNFILWMELVVGTSTGYVYILNQSGAVLTGWPQKIEGSTTSPALGDMDGDHRLDIVIVRKPGMDCSEAGVYAVRGKSKSRDTWRKDR